MTEQLLDGLVSPTESPEKSPPQSLPKGFVLAGNVSPGNISIGDGYLSEEDEPQLISMPVQGQSTPRVKDLTNKVMCVCMHVCLCTCLSGVAIKFNVTCNHTGYFSWMGAFSAGTTGQLEVMVRAAICNIESESGWYC